MEYFAFCMRQGTFSGAAFKLCLVRVFNVLRTPIFFVVFILSFIILPYLQYYCRQLLPDFPSILNLAYFFPFLLITNANLSKHQALKSVFGSIQNLNKERRFLSIRIIFIE